MKISNFVSLCLGFILTYVLFTTSVACEAENFFENGKTEWGIELLQPEDPTVAYAGAELQRALKIISGAEFPQVTSGKRVIVGVEENMKSTPDRVSIQTRDGNLYLTGGSPRSALYAVYEFLRTELGARWLWPGEDGEFLPKREVFALPSLDHTFTPAIRYRGFHMCGDWYKVREFHEWAARNLMNIHRHGNHRFPDRERGFYRMYSSHNVFPPKETFATHPEFFALRNGTRMPQQVCLSSSAGLDVIAERLAGELEQNPGIDLLSLFLPDNQEYCQCPECAGKSVSTAFFDFYNGLTDRLHTRFPELKFATLAYQGYLDVPANPVRNTEFVEIATHGRCNIHTYHDPRCERNAAELKRFAEWKATGTPIGNYAYEYDMFGRDLLFLPIFTVVNDMVQVNMEQNSVVLIPEVCLSPRKGPDEVVGTYTNRISAYLLARLMVEPTVDWHALLKDYCDYAYGPAAVPVYEYLQALDARWQRLDVHRGILGTPAGLADELMTPEVVQMAAARFTEAANCLTSAPEHARFRANLERERVLFNQWLRFVESGTKFDIPHVSDFSQSETGTAVPGMSARFCWTDDRLVVKNFRTPLELVLSTGLNGETWHFRIEKNGQKSQWRVSDVGVKEVGWNPDWTGTSDRAEISFKNLTVGGAPCETPAPRTLWQFRISEGDTTYPNSEGMAGLVFSAAPKTGRVLAYWTGSRERDERNFPRLRATFRDGGWNAEIAATEEEFLALRPDAIWLMNPMFANQLPDTCWEKVRKFVEDGGLLVCVSYSALPLERYFGDASWAVSVRGISEPISLSERRSNFLKEGAWQTTPYDLTRALTREITPAYYLTLAEPEAWEILAAMPRSAAEPEARLVYMARRTYGKGTVLIMGADPRLPFPQLLDNMRYPK